MKTVNLHTEEAPNKWWAARDAQMRNTVNKTRYADTLRVQVERMKLVLDIVYTGSVYEAYGKRGVSIKVDRAVVRDKRSLGALEAEWTQKGWVKKVSPQGVIYRLDNRS